jgi:hypothetical protein
MSGASTEATQFEKIRRMAFAKVYPLYLQKAGRKGRSKEEVDEVIRWLTGYDERGLRRQIDSGCDFEVFFDQAPRFNPDAAKITGVICGWRVEDIQDPLVRKVRYLDKLVDELARGRAMDKVLRK